MVKKITLLLFLFLALQIHATHNRSGEILYQRIAPFVSNGMPVYTYSITVIKYFDFGPNIADRCEDTLNFGDGIQGIAPRINGGNWCGGSCANCGDVITSANNFNMKRSVYGTTHTYAGPGYYVVSSSDRNRSAGVSNISNSSEVVFYIESLIVIYPSGVNASPILPVVPLFEASVGSCYEFNCFAFDRDGDSLSYELVPCMSGPGQLASGYFDPPAGANGSLSIHPATGLLTWCNPQTIAQFNIAIKVKEWRKPYCGAPYALNGYVVRDMQIVVGSPQNFVPTLTTTGFADACMVAGTTFTNVFSAINPTTSLITCGVYFRLAPITYSTGTTGLDYYFNWITSCQDALKQPHLVNVIYLASNNNSALNVKAFKNLYLQKKIYVIPPAPVITSLVKDTSQVTISWNQLAQCQNLKEYNIYRKVGASTWAHAACETGVPASSGFQLIANVAAGNGTFVDNNLWSIPNGSTVNYIITAVMNDCAESYGENMQAVSVIVGLKKEIENYASASVIPNPFSTRLRVSLNDNYSGKTQAVIYSADGKQVFRSASEVARGELNLEVTGLTPGIYFLEVTTDRGTLHRKLVRE